ncbi:11361_t:CDS:2, partial [Entrophospora sp. SA101]
RGAQIKPDRDYDERYLDKRVKSSGCKISNDNNIKRQKTNDDEFELRPFSGWGDENVKIYIYRTLVDFDGSRRLEVVAKDLFP